MLKPLFLTFYQLSVPLLTLLNTANKHRESHNIKIPPLSQQLNVMLFSYHLQYFFSCLSTLHMNLILTD